MNPISEARTEAWSLWWSALRDELLPSEEEGGHPGCGPAPQLCSLPLTFPTPPGLGAVPPTRLGTAFLPSELHTQPARSWGAGLLFPVWQDFFQPSGEATVCADSAILSSALVYSAPFKSCFDKFTFSLLSSFAWRAERALSNRPPPKSPWGSVIPALPDKETKPQ